MFSVICFCQFVELTVILFSVVFYISVVVFARSGECLKSVLWLIYCIFDSRLLVGVNMIDSCA